jgi:hypothetical protein
LSYATHLDTPKVSEKKKVEKLIADLQVFYDPHGQHHEAIRCLIYHNSFGKILWDCLISFFCFIIAIVTPYRIAFYQEEDKTWMMIFNIIDCCLFIDIILTFFTTYTD